MEGGGALKTEKESTSETPFSCSSLCPRTQTADKAQVTFMPSSLAKRRNEVLRILKGFFLCVCVKVNAINLKRSLSFKKVLKQQEGNTWKETPRGDLVDYRWRLFETRIEKAEGSFRGPAPLWQPP